MVRICDGFARLLGTFVLRSGTFALAFMIDVTGSITLVLRCLTMRVALVHDINDLGIGEGQRITMTLEDRRKNPIQCNNFTVTSTLTFW